MINNNFSAQQFSAYKNQQFSRIYHHEQTHKDAAGSLAGPIVIEKDSNGVPNAGHVDIKMPQINTANPDETINDAQTVINSALAPADPSEQDKKVALKAEGILSQAKSQKAENSSNSATGDASCENCSNCTCGNKLNFLA